MSAARGGNLRATSALALVLAVYAARAMAADVEITADTGPVDLDARSGSSAHVAAGVTVTGGISATAQAWTVANDGKVNGGNTVTLQGVESLTGGAGVDKVVLGAAQVGGVYDFGGDATIRAFLDQCGAVPASACAFSAGSPEATRAKWHALLTRARDGLSLDGQRIDDRDILAYVGGSLYTVAPLPGFGRFPGWPAVAEFLEALSHAPAGSPASAAPAPEDSPGPKPAPYATSVGRQLAVICGESPNPATPEAFAAQIGASYDRAGYSAWPFVASCLGWTARAAAPYAGPWDRPSVPVLVIGNSFDPATPLSSSVGMAQDLADARLLIVNGFGHTVLINPSRCAQDRIAAYLIDGALPPAGATCFQDRPPFPGD